MPPKYGKKYRMKHRDIYTNRFTLRFTILFTKKVSSNSLPDFSYTFEPDENIDFSKPKQTRYTSEIGKKKIYILGPK